MRIIVISDTHGNYRALESVFLRNEDAEWFFHLGDGERELNRFLIANPQFTEKVIHVSGNCDNCSFSQDTFVLPLGEHGIFATHGHLYAVNSGTGAIRRAASESGCDIVLFGHTHVRCNKFEDGMYFLNPGSAGCPRDGTRPSFGHIDISPTGVVINIADI